MRDRRGWQSRCVLGLILVLHAINYFVLAGIDCAWTLGLYVNTTLGIICTHFYLICNSLEWKCLCKIMHNSHICTSAGNSFLTFSKFHVFVILWRTPRQCLLYFLNKIWYVSEKIWCEMPNLSCHNESKHSWIQTSDSAFCLKVSGVIFGI